GEGLLEEGDPLVAWEVLEDRNLVAVAGDEDDGEGGRELAEAAGEFDAADFGHDDVGDDDVEGTAGEGIERIFAVVDGVDGEAGFLEGLGEVLVDQGVIFGE